MRAKARTAYFDLSVHRRQFVDHPLDHRHPLFQKAGSAPFSLKGAKSSVWCLVPAGLQKLEILLLEARLRLLVDRVERVHETVA